MQLGSAHGARGAQSLPEALSEASARLGHRPAISLVLADGRQEQSFTSVAQWASKTAHWLQLDHGADADLTMGIVGPPGWVPAVAALGAWWLGLQVVTGSGASSADVVIAGPGSDGTVAWGYAFDGSGEADAAMFTWTVQEFPDHPPAPSGGPGLSALTDGATFLTQHDLLDKWRDATGAAGADASGTAGAAGAWLHAAAVRPLLAGRPTVLLGPGVERGAAEGDRVTDWL